MGDLSYMENNTPDSDEYPEDESSSEYSEGGEYERVSVLRRSRRLSTTPMRNFLGLLSKRNQQLGDVRIGVHRMSKKHEKRKTKKLGLQQDLCVQLQREQMLCMQLRSFVPGGGDVHANFGNDLISRLEATANQKRYLLAEIATCDKPLAPSWEIEYYKKCFMSYLFFIQQEVRKFLLITLNTIGGQLNQFDGYLVIEEKSLYLSYHCPSCGKQQRLLGAVKGSLFSHRLRAVVCDVPRCRHARPLTSSHVLPFHRALYSLLHLEKKDVADVLAVLQIADECLRVCEESSAPGSDKVYLIRKIKDILDLEAWPATKKKGLVWYTTKLREAGEKAVGDFFCLVCRAQLYDSEQICSHRIKESQYRHYFHKSCLPEKKTKCLCGHRFMSLMRYSLLEQRPVARISAPRVSRRGEDTHDEDEEDEADDSGEFAVSTRTKTTERRNSGGMLSSSSRVTRTTRRGRNHPYNTTSSRGDCSMDPPGGSRAKPVPSPHRTSLSKPKSSRGSAPGHRSGSSYPSRRRYNSVLLPASSYSSSSSPSSSSSSPTYRSPSRYSARPTSNSIPLSTCSSSSRSTHRSRSRYPSRPKSTSLLVSATSSTCSSSLSSRSSAACIEGSKDEGSFGYLEPSVSGASTPLGIGGISESEDHLASPPRLYHGSSGLELAGTEMFEPRQPTRTHQNLSPTRPLRVQATSPEIHSPASVLGSFCTPTSSSLTSPVRGWTEEWPVDENKKRQKTSPRPTGKRKAKRDKQKGACCVCSCASDASEGPVYLSLPMILPCSHGLCTGLAPPVAAPTEKVLSTTPFRAVNAVDDEDVTAFRYVYQNTTHPS